MEKNIPQLYYTAASAPCRSVMMVAAALKLKLNLKPVNLMDGDHLRPTFLRISPHHTVPTLVDNEFSMFESRAICIYLVEKYGKNDALYPKNPKTRATINQLIYFDMGTLFKRFYEYFILAFRGEPQDPQKLESLKEALGLLDKFLVEKKFAVGYRLTIADLILLATVSTIDAVEFDFSSYKNVGKWYENMKSTAPGWQENLNGLQTMKEMMAKMMPQKEEVASSDEVKEAPVAAPVVHEVHFKPNVEIIPDPKTPDSDVHLEPTLVQKLIEVTPPEPIQPLAEVEPVQPIQPLAEVEIVQPIQPLAEIEPVQPIQPLAEVEPIQQIQPLAEVEPVQVEVTPAVPIIEIEPAEVQPPVYVQTFQPIPEIEPLAIQGISPLIHVEPAESTTVVVTTTTQQITPLIEITAEPVKTSSEIITETITTTTKEVTQNQEVYTEVVTEVKEIVTLTEQVTGITKVIHVESETKSEVVNGGAIELVQNGKYEGEEVKI